VISLPPPPPAWARSSLGRTIGTQAVGDPHQVKQLRESEQASVTSFGAGAMSFGWRASGPAVTLVCRGRLKQLGVARCEGDDRDGENESGLVR
jgi:hypothetical protein